MPSNKSTNKEPVNKSAFPIVGIGASAGGLETFTELLKNLPIDTGMAFVLVQHLDPKHESLLTELLGKVTQMQVQEAEDGMSLHPNHVYVIPPNTNLAILHGVLHLMPRTESKGPHMPIDYFFRSLAVDQKNDAIGIVLSGTASDGTQGLKTIKGEGGITFAQTPDSAKYDGMPRSAVNAGVADFILPPEGIAKELVIIGKHPYLASRKTGEVIPEEETDVLKKIFILLRSATGVDFTNYKQSTVKRRIARRMVLFKLDKPEDYFQYLQKNPKEIQALYDDILIPVTNFFRDPEVFEGLKTDVFPNITKYKTPDIPVRVWVPGCSTGEEAYSIAIALLEFLESELVKPSIQIFATDISEKAIEKARRGIYPESISTDVSPERLRRFFSPVEDGYEINRTIREMCVFAKHDFTRDPPFSRLDFISCRNVLIYLGSVLQKRVVPIFHYALNPEGFLLLGTSETIGRFTDLFRTVDKKSKTYKKRQIPSSTQFEYTPAEYAFKQPAAGEKPAVTKPAGAAAPKEFEVLKETDHIMLTRYTPAGVVVNEDLEIVQFRGHVGPYLEPSQGRASLNLLSMVKGGLAIDLRTAIHKAKQTNGPIRKELLRIKADEGYKDINIEVVPVKSPTGEYHFIILFEDVTEPANPRFEAAKTSKKKRGKKEPGAEESERELEQLRQELDETKEYLRTIVEEKEAANEELRAANEEIQSSNEELQSINEELETAKEELQSSNEELMTVNDELQNRNIELNSINDDLNNLLVSVNIPIVMLGSDLRIRRFTPYAEKLLNINPTDVGRPVTDIKLRIDIPDLEQMIIEVVDKITIIDKEITDHDGRWYSLWIRPYKTIENKIDGAVISLVDIDTLKRVQHQIEEARKYAEDIVETVREPLIILNTKLEVISANRSFYRTFKVSPEETVNILIYEIGGHQWNIPILRNLLEEVLHKKKEFNDFEVEHDFPRIGNRIMLLNARWIAQENEGREMILLAVEDITERKQIEQVLKDSEERFRAAVDTASDAIITADAQNNIIFWNSSAEKLFGYGVKEVIGQDLGIIVPERYRTDHKRSLDRYLTTGKRKIIGKTVELFGLRKDGTEFPLELSVAAWKTNKETFFTGIIRDITERKYREQLNVTLNEINVIISSTLDILSIIPAVMSKALKAIGCKSNSISLLEEGNWTVKYVSGLPKELIGSRFADEQAKHFALVRRTKTPIYIEDTYNDERVDRRSMEEAGLRSFMLLPIIVKDEVIGTLAFHYRTARVVFAPAQIDFANKLATSISFALENARLYEAQVEAKKQAKAELEISNLLLDAADVLPRAIELPQVLDTLVDTVINIAGVSRAEVRLIDEKTRQLKVVASRGESKFSLDSGFHMEKQTSGSKKSMLKMEPILEDYEKEGLPAEIKKRAGEANSKLVLFVPIILNDEVIGNIGLDEPGQRAEFSERIIRVVEGVAYQAAVAIENARLHGKSVARARTFEALARTGSLITSTLRMEDALEQIISYSMLLIDVPGAFLLLLDDVQPVLRIAASEGIPGYIQKQELAGREASALGFDKTGIKLFESLDELSSIPVFSLCQKAGFISAILFPIFIEGTFKGLLVSLDKKPLHPLEEDLLALSLFTNQAAMAIKNAKSFESEHNIATLLQEALLYVPEKIEGAKFGHIYRSSTLKPGFVGGDFYDLFEMDNDRLGIIVGDVSGKGIEAATLTALVKNTIKAYAYYEETPAKTIARANNVIKKSIDPDMFATAFFGILNKRSGELIYCSAGHPPAFIKGESGITALDVNSPAVGAFMDIEFFDGKAKLNKDTLVIYTDGVTEARHGMKFFGEKGIKEFLMKIKKNDARKIPEQLYKEIASFSRNRLNDDLVVLSISLNI